MNQTHNVAFLDEAQQLHQRLLEAEFAAAQFERLAAFWEEQVRRYRIQLEFAESSLQAAALELARLSR